MGRDAAAEDGWIATDPDTITILNSQSLPATEAYYSMPTQNQNYCIDDFDYCLSSIHHTGPGPGDADLHSLSHFNGVQNQDLGAAYLKQEHEQLLDFEIPLDTSSVNIHRDFIDAEMNKFYNTVVTNLPDDNTRSHIQGTVFKNEGSQHAVEDERRASSPLMWMANAFEDDYNWRKYGQKQVKGSEYPRSYHKCTHPNCDAKKKVEHGDITQIIYKGKHNHPKPLRNRRLVHDEADTGEEGSSYDMIEGLDRELAESVISQLSIENPHGDTKHFYPLDSTENEEVSSPSHCQGADDKAMDETGSKRRRTDNCMVESNMSFRGIREDKIMVQAESVIDIIDDGYRWRKYGQKVVKGNPNPRSYYKCTSAGCYVRKHVERNPQNIKDVITTYEGKHNHEVPPAKNCSSLKNNLGISPSVPFTYEASHRSLTRSSTLPKFENSEHFNPHQFPRTSFPGNVYLNPGLISNFGNGMNFGGSSVYHSNFPMHCRSLGLNNANHGIPQVGMPSSHASDLVNQPLSTLPGSLNSNITPDFIICQGGISQLAQHPVHDLETIRPKQEKMDYITDDSSA